ncbi:MAG: glucuronate isomerase [Halioglobus sp.]
MSTALQLHPDRLFPTQESTRSIARRLYNHVKDMPIISPHGHTDPAWFAHNEPFTDATELLVKPDHYLFRMLYSQGVPLSALGLGSAGRGSAGSGSAGSGSAGSAPNETDNRKIWHLFSQHYHLFRGTPSRTWLDTVFSEVFGLKVALSSATADHYYDHIGELLVSPEYLPRALFERFNIELLATTESPLNDLKHHQTLRDSQWNGRIITAFRPDPVVDPEFEGFISNVAQLGKLTGQDTGSWQGYLTALRQRRDFFRSMGATSTDHGHPSAATADLPIAQCQQLFAKAVQGQCNAAEAELFRAQMLTEMAAMSIADGLVMQIHPGSFRNHNARVFGDFGRDHGADIPTKIEYVKALKPLLDRYGNDLRLSIIVFTLDETTYSRELAPLAGHYPVLKLGPSWWFHDSPEGMRRFREQVTETAGFYNTVGFNDDTRAFMSIPARHDVARRMDCGFLAELVADHRLREDEAMELAEDLSYNLVKKAYQL